RALAPGGMLMLGDVRHAGLLDAFHAAVQLFQAPSSLSCEKLRQRVGQHVAREQELVASPAFFVKLRSRCPEIAHVEVQPKRGRHHHELTEFRYDVRMQIGGVPPVEQAYQWIDWTAGDVTLEAVKAQLRAQTVDALALSRI